MGARASRGSRPRPDEGFARHQRSFAPVARHCRAARAIARETIAAAAEESGRVERRRRGEPLPRRRRRFARAEFALARNRQADQRAVLSRRAPGRRVGDAATLGDIALAFETLGARGRGAGMPLADHYRHLVAHGFLHLIGYDHETDAEAERMEALETRILARLGVADPYRARSRWRMTVTDDSGAGAEAPAQAVSREQPSGLFERLRALVRPGAALGARRYRGRARGERERGLHARRSARSSRTCWRLHEVSVEDVMVPRADIIALALDTPLERGARLLPRRRPFAPAGL